ncbi:MAG: hypothetical protein IJJ13_10020 [Lachnospiraceae bacterium]|nr:hypothetical protein [Lachnospiraceae bacterium]
MKHKSILLLRTMMEATSNLHIVKYSKDPSAVKNARGALIGNVILGVLLAGLVGAFSYGMAFFGFGAMVPMLVATVISFLSLVLPIFKSNGYLYEYPEYDSLMSMPFSVRTVVADRFLLMYLKDLPWNMLFSLSALVGCCIASMPGAVTIISWIILTPFISLLPTVIVSLLGAFITGIGSNFRHKKLIQTILTFVLMIPLIFSRFIIDYLIRDQKIAAVMTRSSEALSGISKVVPTVGWFAKATYEADPLSCVLMVVVSLGLYLGVVWLISINYRKINSRLTSHATRRKGKKTARGYQKKTAERSILFKDWKRITGSTLCATNLGMGAVISIVAAVILPFVRIESIASMMANGHPVDLSGYHMVWPAIVYFFAGMMPTTVASPSLEGKNDWILKSMPVTKKTICKGKIGLNLLLNLLPALLAVLGGMISMRATAVEYVIGFLMMIAMCLFSSIYGMQCGLKYCRVDWKNEVEVVKQGRAVTFYMLPNLFATMGLVILMIFFGATIGSVAGGLTITVVYFLLALLSYQSLRRLTR